MLEAAACCDELFALVFELLLVCAGAEVAAGCGFPVPTSTTFSTGAFFTQVAKVFDETTLSPVRVTRFVFSRMPYSPSVCTFSVPFGSDGSSFFTVLNGIFDSVVSIFAPWRSMEIVVDSSTFVVSDGFT